MKFTIYCPQTSTGLWSGTTETERYEETLRRQFLEDGDDCVKNYPGTQEQKREFLKRNHIFSYFKFHTMSVDFMIQLVNMLDENWRAFLENSLISSTLLAKEDVPQNQIINSIQYVKNGLVKYNEILNEVIKYKSQEKNNG